MLAIKKPVREVDNRAITLNSFTLAGAHYPGSPSYTTLWASSTSLLEDDLTVQYLELFGCGVAELIELKQ